MASFWPAELYHTPEGRALDARLDQWFDHSMGLVTPASLEAKALETTAGRAYRDVYGDTGLKTFLTDYFERCIPRLCKPAEYCMPEKRRQREEDVAALDVRDAKRWRVAPETITDKELYMVLLKCTDCHKVIVGDRDAHYMRLPRSAEFGEHLVCLECWKKDDVKHHCKVCGKAGPVRYQHSYGFNDMPRQHLHHCEACYEELARRDPYLHCATCKVLSGR